MKVSSTRRLALIVNAISSTLTINALTPPGTSSTTNTCPSNTMTKFRSVKRVLERTPKHWVGDGFHVHPVFASLAFTEEISPMLMFDYGAPKQFTSKVGSPRGVGQHPHRGFET